MIDGLGRKHKLDDAYKLFKRMLDEGHELNVVVYTSLINNLFKWGRKYDGHKIFKDMIHRVRTLDLTLYNISMNYVLRAREIDKGCKIFEEIKERGYVPYVCTYSTLMHGLIKVG